MEFKARARFGSLASGPRDEEETPSMCPSENTPTDEVTDASAEGEAPAEKLNYEVKIDTKSACERHITVTIPHEEVERYFSNAFSELMPKAAIPGFRPGRAPRKLVEARFRKDVGDQVKGSLLMDSLTQISEDGGLSPISEPDFDPVAVSIPDDG